MAPKLNIRTALSTLIAVIAALAVLASLAAPASACNCTYGYVLSSGGTKCYYGGPGEGLWKIIPYSDSHEKYEIFCQEDGPSVFGNRYWDRLFYKGFCYVNAYYLITGCENRCSNLPSCY